METSPRDRCTFPNLGKAACAQVRKRDSASNAQQITNTCNCSFKTRQSHRRQQWPACMCVLTKGKRDPIRRLMTDYFCNCLRKMSPAPPWETVTRTETGQGGELHPEDEGPGGALYSQSGWPQRRGAGLCIPSSGRPCSSGTGQHWSPKGFRGWQEVRGRTLPNPNK